MALEAGVIGKEKVNTVRIHLIKELPVYWFWRLVLLDFLHGVKAEMSSLPF